MNGLANFKFIYTLVIGNNNEMCHFHAFQDGTEYEKHLETFRYTCCQLGRV